MADTSAWMKRGATMADIRRHARSLMYLGSVDKIMTALANEYGTERPMPSRASIKAMLEQHNAKPFRREYA